MINVSHLLIICSHTDVLAHIYAIFSFGLVTLSILQHGGKNSFPLARKHSSNCVEITHQSKQQHVEDVIQYHDF